MQPCLHACSSTYLRDTCLTPPPHPTPHPPPPYTPPPPPRPSFPCSAGLQRGRAGGEPAVRGGGGGAARAAAGPASLCFRRIWNRPGQLRWVLAVLGGRRGRCGRRRCMIGALRPTSSAFLGHPPPPTSRLPAATWPPLPHAGEVRGNPTEYYRRAGSGSSYGAGIKVGAIRAEAIRDNNAGKWHAFLAYGERF